MDSHKVVIITGASRGIGAATARLFAREGYAVCVNYISNDTAAASIKSAILEEGGRCIAVRADVAVADEVKRLFETVDQQLGRLSVLVNNAAILRHQCRLDDVNVSSVASKSGAPNEYVDYAASKGAVDTLTKGLALEVATEGIRVNGVRPGLIHTDMHASGGEPNRIERLQSKIPMQRGGQAVEVAEAILWLASDKSSFATGSFIDLAGGL